MKKNQISPINKGRKTKKSEQKQDSFSFAHYVKVCFWNKFFCFKGRAGRKEYWAFQLTDFAVVSVFYAAIKFGYAQNFAFFITRDIVTTIFIIPLLSVTVRRFHDIGLSGWWSLPACLVPLLPVAFLGIKGGNEKENKYGAIPDTKTVTSVVFVDFAKQNVKDTISDVVDFYDAKQKQKEKRKSKKSA